MRIIKQQKITIVMQIVPNWHLVVCLLLCLYLLFLMHVCVEGGCVDTQNNKELSLICQISMLSINELVLAESLVAILSFMLLYRLVFSMRTSVVD